MWKVKLYSSWRQNSKYLYRRSSFALFSVGITDNLTVADIFSAWGRYRIYCFLKYGENSLGMMPVIAIDRPYLSAKSQPEFPQNTAAGPFQIRFDTHVATSIFKVLKTDHRFLTVQAKALGSDEKFFEGVPESRPRPDGCRQQGVSDDKYPRKSAREPTRWLATPLRPMRRFAPRSPSRPTPSCLTCRRI